MPENIEQPEPFTFLQLSEDRRAFAVRTEWQALRDKKVVGHITETHVSRPPSATNEAGLAIPGEYSYALAVKSPLEGMQHGITDAFNRYMAQPVRVVMKAAEWRRE